MTVPNYESQAISRLIEQYKEKPVINALIKSDSDQYQDIETVLTQLIDDRFLDTCVGEQLDVYGKVLDQPRQGFDDATYRILLYGKIAQINSEGRIEDLISVYSILMGADSVNLYELFPAHVSMYSIGSNPLGVNSEIINAVKKTKAAGVSVQLYDVPDGYLGFVGDVNGLGLGDSLNPNVGGHLSSILA
jgi:hypothetical protein